MICRENCSIKSLGKYNGGINAILIDFGNAFKHYINTRESYFKIPINRSLHQKRITKNKQNLVDLHNYFQSNSTEKWNDDFESKLKLSNLNTPNSISNVSSINYLESRDFMIGLIKSQANESEVKHFFNQYLNTFYPEYNSIRNAW